VELKEYDVVIVGAGPAGCQCARELAKENIKVILIEKQKEIGEPNFSTAGTPEETIKVFGLPEEVAPYVCDKFYFKSLNLEKIFTLKKYRSYVIDFRKMRQWLASEVSKNGGEISVSTTAKDLVIENGKTVGVRYQGLISSGVIKAKVIIDATGIAGILSKDLQIFDSTKTIQTLETEFEMTNLTLPIKNALYFYMGNEFLPNGYAWIFPLSDNIVKIGFAKVLKDNESTYNLEIGLKKFIESIPWLNKSQPLEFHISSFPYNHTNNCVRDNYIVIGSAAGHLNPLAGEGIRHALYSGKFAAQVVNEALTNNDTSAKKLSKFNNLWKDYSKDNWKMCRAIAYQMYNNTSTDKTDKLLKSLQKFSGDEIYDIFFNYNFEPYLAKVIGSLSLSEIKKIKDIF